MRALLGRIPSNWFLYSVPLLLFPLMINLRIFPFVAPNEEPKWGVLVLCGLLMAAAIAYLIWQKREATSFRISIPGVLFTLFFLLLAIGIFIGPNKIEGLIRFTFWLIAGCVWLVAVAAARGESRWRELLGWSLSIGAFIFSLRYWWSYALDYGKPGYNVSVLFSPIGHVNFTGDVLVVLLPALIWLLAVRGEPVMRVINWFSVATTLTVLLVASSRGALGGLTIGLLLLLPFIVRHGRGWLDAMRKRRFAIAPAIWVGSALLASLIVYNLLPYHYRDLARVSGSLQGSFDNRTLTPGAKQPPFAEFWLFLSPLLGDRTPIFASTTAMTLKAPLLGNGTGNFAWIYPGYSNRYPDFRDTLSSERTFTTNPHNVVLQLASQNGIPAALIFLGLLCLFWYRLINSLWHKWDGWLAAGVLAITSAIFDSMFNHVFFNPASMFVFALLGGAWWGYVVNSGSSRAVSLPASLNRPAAALLMLVAVGLSIWPGRWLISEWNVGNAMFYMRYPAKAEPYYERAYSWDRYNFRAVFGEGQVAYRQRRYEDAVRLFNHFESIYPYNPPALNMLGAAYLMRGKLPEAEAALQRAVNTLPSFTIARQNLARVQAMLRARAEQQVAPPAR